MAEKNKILNPYANADGSPKDGKEPEFFEWAHQKHLSELELLPEEERKRILEAEKSLAERMDS